MQQSQAMRCALTAVRASCRHRSQLREGELAVARGVGLDWRSLWAGCGEMRGERCAALRRVRGSEYAPLSSIRPRRKTGVTYCCCWSLRVGGVCVAEAEQSRGELASTGRIKKFQRSLVPALVVAIVTGSCQAQCWGRHRIDDTRTRHSSCERSQVRAESSITGRGWDRKKVAG